jgi:hypothetical protein
MLPSKHQRANDPARKLTCPVFMVLQKTTYRKIKQKFLPIRRVILMIQGNPPTPFPTSSPTQGGKIDLPPTHAMRVALGYQVERL